jgi:hypothetical protein
MLYDEQQFQSIVHLRPSPLNDNQFPSSFLSEELSVTTVQQHLEYREADIGI